MANRITPPDPESNRQSQARKLEEAQKIAAISSVDPDAQARKRRFQEIMGASEEMDPLKVESEPVSAAPPQPSPYQSSFYQQDESSDFNLNPIPSPYNSAPPDLTMPSPQAESLLSDQGLPQSPDYWYQVDLPDQPINESPELAQEPSQSEDQETEPDEQTTQSWPQELQQRTKNSLIAKKKPGQQGFQELFNTPEKKLEPSPFGPPGKAVTKKNTASPADPPPFLARQAEETKRFQVDKTPSEENEASTSLQQSPSSTKKSDEKETSKISEDNRLSPSLQKNGEDSTPLAKYWETQPERIQSRSVSEKEKEKMKGQGGLQASPTSNVEEPLDQQPLNPPKEFSPFFQQSGEGSEQKNSRGHDPKKGIDIIAPALPGFSVEIHSAAASSATAAASYLRPEAIPLFYQMVGTIFIMTTQGISTTEIHLNNPAFAGSKFFGASIEIIKYSSAPDSLNIRLNGSNEAVVTAFNQNIPGLLAAFQTGRFRFRIGRIDAGYAAERPVLHRKEEKDRGDGSNEGDNEKK